MDRLVEQPFATALGTLAVSWVLFDVGNQTGVEDRFAIRGRVKPAIEVEIRVLEAQPRLLADPLQGLQPIRQQHGIRFINRRDGKRSQDITKWLQASYDAARLDNEKQLPKGSCLEVSPIGLKSYHLWR